MGNPEDKEKFQRRRRNHIAKDLREIKIFHEKVRSLNLERSKKISIHNYKDFEDDD